MNETKLKKNTAKLSLLSNSILIVIKLIAGFLSGSFGIISEAIHSGTDCLASYIAYFAIRHKIFMIGFLIATLFMLFFEIRIFIKEKIYSQKKI